MIFNKHFALEGMHAFMSPSKPHWVKYDQDKLDRVFLTHLAAQRGTQLHDLAKQLILLGVKLPRASKTLNLYVNDAIGYRMTPEQSLFYSRNCFGTADAIAFRRDLLRISDLKTGVNQSSFAQLEVYAALFCLEYQMSPFKIGMELRIYQNDDLREYAPEADDIMHIMEAIKFADKRIEYLREEADQ